MTAAAHTYESVSALVRRETAMVYDAGKEYLVEARLRPLATAAGCDVDAYVRRLQVDPAERRKAMDALTINETSWFRDHAPYQVFTDVLLPRLLEARAASRHLRIWSAACSSGQEAYSICMLLDQHLPPGWTYEILATDVSTAMLERVRAGRYNAVEVNRGLPATSLVRYFTRVGSEWEIAPALREHVTTRHVNLATPFFGMGPFDLVMLRNVLIYFEQATKHDVLRRMRPMVEDHGYLMLGSSETTLDLPPDVAALWGREQHDRVQVHLPATRTTPITTPPMTTPTTTTTTGAVT